MRIAHRNLTANWFAVPVSDYVDPEYEAEVQRTTRHAEREYRKAHERLQRAEERLAEALRKQQAQKLVKELRDLVALRRSELKDCECLMTAAPVAQADKQIRHRAGRDDHLELGMYKQPKRRKRRAS